VTVRKTIDIIIGTFCIHHNLPLLHDDRDFDPLTKHLKLKAVQCGWGTRAGHNELSHDQNLYSSPRYKRI